MEAIGGILHFCRNQNSKAMISIVTPTENHKDELAAQYPRLARLANEDKVLLDGTVVDPLPGGLEIQDTGRFLKLYGRKIRTEDFIIDHIESVMHTGTAETGCDVPTRPGIDKFDVFYTLFDEATKAAGVPQGYITGVRIAFGWTTGGSCGCSTGP